MIAYFDCFAGIAGDMTVAALLDLGLEEEYLKDQLSALDLKGYSVRSWKSKRGGLAGVRFEVHVDEGQPQRSYREIRKIVSQSSIDAAPKTRALEIFDAVARAEARVHAVDPEEVHFHELGAVDSIVDIVGVAIGIHRLGIDTVICSPLPLSRGFVDTCHGTIPTPAPATMEILRDVPVVGAAGSIEMVTPTGAAIASTLASAFGSYPPFVPHRTGYGLGKSDPKEFPNALRIVLGSEMEHSLVRDSIGILECQVDDLDPRILGGLMEQLLSSGAVDVTYCPVQMKKNRPGTLITAFAPPELITPISHILLTHTTTLGVRVSRSDRLVLPRSSEIAQTSMGDVRVKIVELPGGRQERRPEFDDVRAIANRTGRPTRDVLRVLDRELNEL